MIAVYWQQVPGAWWLLSLHVVGLGLLLAAIRSPRSFVFRHWYPLPYVGCCYKEMAILIPVIRGVDYDRELAALDHRIWGAYPTVWVERLYHPAFTEFLQVIYSLFIPVVLLVAVILWRRRQYAQFRYYAFLIAVGFLVSYIGYVLVPVRGPRFLLAGEQHASLQGLWLFHLLQNTLDKLEAAHYDCFPSGHTELTILAWWGSRWISNNLFRFYSVYAVFIIFSTVYLRYHYTVDLLAGMAVAAALILVSPMVYSRLEKREPVESRRDPYSR